MSTTIHQIWRSILRMVQRPGRAAPAGLLGTAVRTAFLGAARVHHPGEAGPRTIRVVLDHDLPRAAQVKGGEQQENRALPTSTFLVEFRDGRGMEPGVPAIAWTESNRPRNLTFASLILSMTSS